MVKFSNFFNRIHQVKVLVIGDLILDQYTYGQTSRISPEAPVPVMQVMKEENLPGGAGNVALNLQALGAQVILLSRIGNDRAGIQLKDSLTSMKVTTDYVFCQRNWQTSHKTRVIAANQQLLRIDYEEIKAIDEHLEDTIITHLPTLLHNIDIIAISDYGKGFLTDTLLSSIIQLGKQKNIPIIVDPKGADFSKYYGATIIKPNRLEAYKAANCSMHIPLETVAKKLLTQSNAEHIVITLSEEGISYFSQSGVSGNTSAKVREVKDVTGAGDTVLAALTFALANKLNLEDSLRFANLCAGVAVEHIGCVNVNLAQVVIHMLKENIISKVFNNEHNYLLKAIVRSVEYQVIILEEEKLSIDLAEKIENINQTSIFPFFYVKDGKEKKEFVYLLSFLIKEGIILTSEEAFSMVNKTYDQLKT